MTKILACVAVVGLLVVSSSSVFAGSGASHFTPAYSAQNPTESRLQPATGLTGARAYAPGQQMLKDMKSPATAPGNGAAVYAPGFLK